MNRRLRLWKKLKNFRGRISEQHDERRGKEQYKLCSGRQRFKTKVNQKES